MITADRGYLHGDYAATLAHVGTPQRLPSSRGWILRRRIPGTSHEDAVGPYPLFCCHDWEALSDDLRQLDDLVSLTLVADPFSAVPRQLEEVFDVVVPFKEHLVVDLARPPAGFVSRHHRRAWSRAMRHLTVERCVDPVRHEDDWLRLYAHLATHRDLRGAAAFPDEALVRQLRVPGMVMLRAVADGDTVGMTLWYHHDDVGYYHLGASDPVGYRLGASHALLWASIEQLSDVVAWLDLGAAPGVATDADDGLTRFKRGWSTGSRTAYLCGAVLDPRRYERLVTSTGTACADYFPAYRAHEVLA